MPKKKKPKRKSRSDLIKGQYACISCNRHLVRYNDPDTNYIESVPGLKNHLMKNISSGNKCYQFYHRNKLLQDGTPLIAKLNQHIHVDSNDRRNTRNTFLRSTGLAGTTNGPGGQFTIPAADTANDIIHGRLDVQLLNSQTLFNTNHPVLSRHSLNQLASQELQPDDTNQDLQRNKTDHSSDSSDDDASLESNHCGSASSLLDSDSLMD